ncbi:UDP-N-acetylmuramoyl-L-alanine--D-glutamate ligase [Propionivibrio dicarboxylicus]|uniref:UDP-N-acetylmuramoylalanine--D-glutamate ligase n=1 Tax=Propionivibrio dicarboxylicus TaxID=83767 RepID=A0A1G8FEM4_9RHOO|nr:UDP-N-acetylmuramoyl-L-alanine--D-glutamate ligase [Propionivibrio dicarboxylicus]SDH80536.1 UDP-N-acetylmuramoylalanine--D-glutamate ligase [Propionivibrio dicarboxylicus]
MNVQGKQVLVIGLGESGLAMARWLAREGASVRVVDSRQAPPNAAALKASLPAAELVCGGFPDSAFAGIDLMAISPGVPVETPAVQAALARGVPLVSEIELFVWGVRRHASASRLIAITGSNGKTTTTALTAHLLNSIGMTAVACGNISPSALDALMAAQDSGAMPKVWVVELSSFQLETTQSLAADAATVLNVSEDHLDRHGDMAGYAAAKARVFAGAQVRVLNRDDAVVASWADAGERCVSFGLDRPSRNNDYGIDGGWIARGAERLVKIAVLPISGLHNAANVMAALALCEGVGVAPHSLFDGLMRFSGLAHRVEKVADIAGVTYFDDSKGTNVGATLAALQGLGRKVAIILGGEGKDQDFTPLRAALAMHGRAVALIGRDAGLIGRAIDGCGLPTQVCADMDAAVRWCAEQAKAGDAVLLSPACASFDMFRNYAHRAEVFIAAVRELAGGGD